MDALTNALKSAWRRTVPATSRARLSRARERGRDLLNYALFRSRLVGLFRRVGIWPHALYIEGTNICNARCVFCAYPQMERPKVTMPVELFRGVVDQYLALGPAEIDLTPIVGDPFADRHLFERLDLLAARPAARGFHFYTNAVLMRPDQIERLVKYDARFSIFCSFGGFDRETYHRIMGIDKFDEAVAAIKGLVEAKARTGSAIKVQVNLRVPRGSERGEFWGWLKDRQAAGLVTVGGVDEFDNWGGKIPDADLRAAGLVPKPPPVHRGPCYRLLTGPTVLADGRVNACCCRDVEASLVIGDVKKTPLAEILSGPELKELVRRHENDDFPEACKVCTQYESFYPKWMRLLP